MQTQVIGMRDPCSHITRLDVISAKLRGADSGEIHRTIQAHLAECDDPVTLKAAD